MSFQAKHKEFQKPTFIFNLYSLVGMSLFIALSIVFGKYLAFNITSAIRISLENIPIIIAAIAYGPIAGAIVGAAADLIGCFLVGYSINPIITLGAISIGIISGISYKISIKLSSKPLVQSLFCILPSHIIGSVIIKTIGLYIYYKLPFWLTISTRALTYIIVSIAEIIVLYILLNRKLITKFAKKN